jgi:hypothetical protein
MENVNKMISVPLVLLTNIVSIMERYTLTEGLGYFQQLTLRKDAEAICGSLNNVLKPYVPLTSKDVEACIDELKNKKDRV